MFRQKDNANEARTHKGARAHTKEREITPTKTRAKAKHREAQSVTSSQGRPQAQDRMQEMNCKPLMALPGFFRIFAIDSMTR